MFTVMSLSGADRRVRTKGVVSGSPQLASGSSVPSPGGNAKAKCPRCNKTVLGSTDSMCCDKCESYTHLKCEPKISKQLYDAISECPGNPLVYLCSACRLSSFTHEGTVTESNSKLEAITNKMVELESILKGGLVDLEGFGRVGDKILRALEDKQVDGRLDSVVDRITKVVHEQVAAVSCQNLNMTETLKGISLNIATVNEKVSTRSDANTSQQIQSEIKKSYAEVVSKFQEKTELLQNSITNHAQGIVEQQQMLEQERKDQELRAKNIIVYGIAETQDMAQTASVVNEFLHAECSLDVKIDRSNIIRLGKLMKDKNRPLRITLSSDSVKWDVLKRINWVKAQGVFAKLDLNRVDREKDLALRKELRKAKESDPNNTYKIYKQCIIKVQK